MEALVSIIIPHFNRSRLLHQTLQSVKDQAYTHWEVIVIDDQSDISDWRSVKGMASERVKILQRMSGTKGPSVCRNIGASHAEGQYLLFLDSDDLLAPHCLHQRVSVMQRHHQLDAAVFLMQEFESEPGDRNAIFNRSVEPKRWVESFIQNSNPWQTMCPIWKKESFLETGGFDENLFYMEDPELHLRALYSGQKFQTFYELPADCFYRAHHLDDTKSNFYYNSIKYRIRFFQKLTSDIYERAFITKQKQNIKIGVNNLIRTFLYSRRNQFPELYSELINWMKSSGLYSDFELKKYQFLMNTGNAGNPLARMLRLKGLCYKLLPE